MKTHRNTPKRKLLLELISRTKGHVDADELHRLAREHGARISLSTVYRNLRVFKELKLVSARDFGETHQHYEVKGPSEHHHLVCLSCGQVIEFESSLVGRVAKKVQQEKGFLITGATLRLEGHCPTCQQKAS